MTQAIKTHTMIEHYLPFLQWRKQVTKRNLKADMMAGLTGAVIVLPQGIAYAAIAGLPPEYGLYTAIVTAVIAAMFGSSMHLISGPTAAISFVVFASLSAYKLEPGSPEFITLALTLTFLAGLFQFVFGLIRMGNAVNFVSHTVVIGFTSGAALLIASSQIKNLLALDIPHGESFLHTWFDIIFKIDQTNIYVVIVGIVTMAAALLAKKLKKGSPYLLIGMVVGSVVNYLIDGASQGVELVGAIPASLPPLSMPDFSYDTVKNMVPQAFAIALLGLVEAVSIARSVAAKSKQQIDGNQEFIGQGLSNIVGSFFSSYAGSGSFTRSGINYDAGAKTPISAVFASIFLLLIMFLVADISAHLPIASMAASIMLVAYGLIDFSGIKQILTVSKTETSIFLTTFFATLFLHLEFAIYFGVLLSLILFLHKTSKPNVVALAPNPSRRNRSIESVEEHGLTECPQLKIIRIDMSIYFGSVNAVQKEINHIIKQGYHSILIDSVGINMIDLAGAEMIEQEALRLEKLGGGLYFYRMKSNVINALKRSTVFEHIGDFHFFPSKRGALHWIATQMDEDVCSRCEKRIFRECNDQDMDKL